MRKKWAGLSCVLAFALLASACGAGGGGGAAPENGGAAEEGAANEQVTLRFAWWGSDVRHEATLAAINKYMELNPNVRVEAEYGGFDGYEQKLKTQLAGGTAADLVQLDQPWLYDLTVGDDMFVDLNTMGESIDLSAFDDQFLQDYSVIDGKLLGLPTGSNGMVMVYNKDFFQRHGIPEDTQLTWENMLEIGKRVYEESGGKDVLLNVDYPLSEMFQKFVRQKTGKNYVEDDYTLGFDYDTAVEAMTTFRAYLDNGVIPPFEDSSAYEDKVETHPKWYAGEFGMILTWASVIPPLLQADGFEVDVMTHMVAEDALNTAVVARPSQLFAITKTSEHPEEAAKLLNWLLNDPEAAVILKDSRGPSASKTALAALEEQGLIDPTVSKATQLAMERSGGPESALAMNAEMIKILSDVIQKLGYGRSTPEEAAQELIDKLGAKLEELK